MIAEGQWKPTSCGDQTFVQSSVVSPVNVWTSKGQTRTSGRPRNVCWSSLICSGVGPLLALGAELAAFAKEDADSIVGKVEGI